MSTTTDLNLLLDLAAYRKEFPPAKRGVRSTDPVVLHLTARTRLVLHVERDCDSGYGYGRAQQLAHNHNIHSASHDARQFAQSLVRALADELSPRQLDELHKAFRDERDEVAAARTACG